MRRLTSFSKTYRGLGVQFQRWGEDYRCPGWRVRVDLWAWRFEFGYRTLG